MLTLQSAPSSALSPAMVRDLRRMLDEAFDGEFTDADWEHARGGQHVWVGGPAGILSHGALVPRTIVCGGRTLQVGYVEAVATRSAFRGRGHGTAVLRRLAELIEGQYELGALATGEHGFYSRLGWETWLGPTFVAGPRGRERTADDDGGILVYRTPRTPPLDLHGEIVADWRDGDVW